MLNFLVDIEEGLRIVAVYLTFVVIVCWLIFEIIREGSLWQPVLFWHLLLYLSGYYDGWTERLKKILKKTYPKEEMIVL